VVRSSTALRMRAVGDVVVRAVLKCSP